ncbi:MAG: hypothetical protein JO354_14340 [Verrucomicrobia bacterium]|nr:hypothetical protein [Verrucomicrobiota bacterium]
MLGLLAGSRVAIAQTHVAPRRPINVIVLDRFCRRYLFPPVAPTSVFYPVPYPVPYLTTQYSAPSFIPASPAYLLLGSASTIRPQLVFQDGTSYTVADYWRENDQLHFITLEESGTKSVPHTVPFETLDLQRTKQAAATQGFHFVIRDEPLQQWLEHRAQREKLRAGTREKS